MWMWDKQLANVIKVSEENYNKCRATKGVTIIKKSMSSGRMQAFKTPGTRYFISSVAGKCAAGQKLKVIVNACM